MQYQKSQVSSQRLTANGQFRRFGGNGTNGQAPVLGSIVSQDSNSMTVKLQDGSTKLVLLSGNTAVSKTDPGSSSDLKTGDNVLVTGTTNSDGSVTAQNVMINPQLREATDRRVLHLLPSNRM